jgi:hypothetical protein
MISAISFELTGGAIIFVHAKIVSVLSLPNLRVTQGVQTIFASSCILQLSVTTAHDFEIISITSEWCAKAGPYAKLFGYFFISSFKSSLNQYLSIANHEA